MINGTDALKTEFPMGTTIYDLGDTRMYVIGYIDDESLWASPVHPDQGLDLAEQNRAGVPVAHVRFFKEHFTDREAA